MTKARWALLAFALSFPLVCCCGGGAWFLRSSFGNAASRLDSELDAAKKAGLPLTASDLEAFVKVSDAENAAPTYMSLLKEANKDKPLGRALVKVGDGGKTHPSEAEWVEAKKRLSRVAPVLETARADSHLPHCAFSRRWDAGTDLKYPEFVLAKNLARALCFEAQIRADGGDLHGALEEIGDAQRIGRQMGEQPLFVGYLVQIAIEAMAESALDRIVARHPKDQTFLAEAAKLHDGFGPLADFRKGLLGELVL